MSLVAPPPRDELGLLIREARARQRRRRLVGVAALALVAGSGIGLYAVLGGGATKPKHGTGGSRLLASAPRCRSDQLRSGGRWCPQSRTVFASPPGGSVPLRARLARAADVPAVVWACAREAWVAQVVPGKTNPDTSN